MQQEIFGIPDFEDQEKQRRANILLVTLFAAMFFITAIVIFSGFMDPEHTETWLMGGAGTAVLLVSFALLRKGKLELACWLIVILSWLIFTLDLVFIAGIRGVSIYGQILIVIFSGLAISGRSALILSLVTMAVNLIILQLEQYGILTQPFPLPAGYTRWFIQTIYTLLAAFYIWVADKSIRKALTKSRETADRYRALFERTNDGVVILDLDWCVTSANHQVVELLGYSQKEFIGLHVIQWEDQKNPSLLKENRERILQGEDIPIFEDQLVRKDGSSVPVELSMALVHDSSGKPCHVQCIIRNITERKDYEKRLQRQALYDPLTSLPNRALFEDRFQEAYANTDSSLVALLFIDLDNFKWVNDQFGHAVGDQVLQKLGKRLQASIRESDTVARLGGDEFVVIIEGIRSKQDVSKIAEKLLVNISSPIQFENHSIEITASIGIQIDENNNLPYVELLKNSDFAMYQVKDSGKNDFRFYDTKDQ
jgi:diguanylate cyclase (GGDEF)-like protein/PAS domain S-box-containing protein